MAWYEGINSPEWETKLRSFFSKTADWKDWRIQHQTFFDAFPDFQSKIDGMIGEGDHVAVWSTVSGTFSQPFEHGDFAGIEPNGQKLEWQEVWIIDFSGDEPDAWFIMNELERLNQLNTA
jgi:predicted ester cyclase